MAQTPNLGSASSFAIFTAVGAFNSSGTTHIRGDIGTNSGAYTGSPVVIGATHIADAISATAASDVNTAYNEIVSYTCGSTISATLAGQTLTPNIYCITSAASLSGDLIFDAQGNPNAVFIIKINGALTTGTFSNILLVNGANTNHIYWQINGLLDIAGGSVFRGTALVNGAITLNTNSFFYGRALSIVGAINIYDIQSIYYDGGLWEGYVSNDFGNLLNWGYKEVPYSGQTIAFIPLPGNDCRLDTLRTIQNYFNESNKNLDLHGNNLEMLGSINQSSSGQILGEFAGSELSFLDTSIQILPANAIQNNILANLTLNNLAGAAINGELILRNNLSILNGNLETNGFLILSSSATQTASITEIVSGSITGLITSQRYIPANGRKYRFLSSPLLGTSTLQWRDNGGNTSGIGTQITGQTGTVDSSQTHQNSAFIYDEPDATAGNDINHRSKWDSIDGNTNLVNGKGYRIFIRGDRSISLLTANSINNETNLWVRGTNPAASISIPLTYTPAAAMGWNLIGNPYACTLDWNEISAQGSGAFNALDNAIYVWNPLNTNLAGGGYTSYVNGVGSGTPFIGTRYISSWQGFFVKANGAVPVLTINESHKVSNQAGGSFFKSGEFKPNCLRLQLIRQNLGIDDAVLYFENGSSKHFDPKFDALDLTEALGIFTENKKEILSISGMPLPKDSTHIPLNIALSGGNYQLAISNLTSFLLVPEIKLIDHYLNKETLLKNLDTLTFFVDETIPATFGSNRFELVIGNLKTGIKNLEKPEAKFVLLTNPVSDFIELQSQNFQTSISYKIYGMDGKDWIHGENKMSNEPISVQQLPNGIYCLSLHNENYNQVIKFVKGN